MAKNISPQTSSELKARWHQHQKSVLVLCRYLWESKFRIQASRYMAWYKKHNMGSLVVSCFFIPAVLKFPMPHFHLVMQASAALPVCIVPLVQWQRFPFELDMNKATVLMPNSLSRVPCFICNSIYSPQILGKVCAQVSPYSIGPYNGHLCIT